MIMIESMMDKIYTSQTKHLNHRLVTLCLQRYISIGEVRYLKLFSLHICQIMRYEYSLLESRQEIYLNNKMQDIYLNN